MRSFSRYLLLSSIIAGVLAVFGLVSFSHKTTTYRASAQKVLATPPGRIKLMPLTVQASETPSAAEPTTTPVTQLAPTATPQPVPQKKSAPAPVVKKTAAVPAAVKPAIPAASCSGSLTQQFICLFNEYRNSRGLSKLSYDQALAQVALGHSTWMAQTGKFSHEGINGSHLGDRCRAVSIVCRGENLAMGINSAQQLLNMWKASPAHNAILLGKYTTMGLGISGNYITLLVN